MSYDCTRARLALFLAALVVAVLGTTLVAMPVANASAPQVGTTTVTVSPAQADLKCGESATIDFRINDVQSLFGIDVKVKYDPSIVEVIDSDGNALGLQVQPGDLPDVSSGQGLVQVNAVDENAGTINYAALRLNPAPAQSGSGVMFSVKFKAKADGSSPISYLSVLLSDPEARPIQANQVNGQINVECGGQPNPTATTAPGKPTKPPGGKPTKVPPGDYCWHTVKPGDTLYSIANHYGTTVDKIMYANGLSNPNMVYVGQKLKIPDCKPGHEPPTKPPSKPPTKPPTKPPHDVCMHTVQPGDTLYAIARRYGVTAHEIMYANGLTDPNYIVVGQVLKIPGCKPGYPSPCPAPPCPAPPQPQPPCPAPPCPMPPVEPPPGAGCFQYTVQPGDSLSSIALQYCDTVYAIAQRNGLVNPHLIYVGQVLTVCGCGQPGPTPPQPGPCRAMHTVAPCETLYGIALQYGSTVHAITVANNLANPNLIYVGQQLCIP